MTSNVRVDVIERSDTYVDVGRKAHVAARGGRVPPPRRRPFVSALSQSFPALGTPSERMVVVLAHELRHAREVLDADIASNARRPRTACQADRQAACRERMGEQYETAAQQLASVVTGELRMSTPRSRSRGRTPIAFQ